MDKPLLKVVDLFSGCGGLSIGFDSYKSSTGEKVFETVLAIDNWKPAIEVLCQNHSETISKKNSIGRVADLTWFDHPSEALLYYLNHYSIYKNDTDLLKNLRKIGLNDFFASLKALDTTFMNQLSIHAQNQKHIDAFSKVDKKVFTLALCKTVMKKLHLSSIKTPELDIPSLPWAIESMQFKSTCVNNKKHKEEKFLQSAQESWDRIVQLIINSSNSKGRGQHKGNAVKMCSLASYFQSSAGLQLKEIWTNWYSSRIALRADFCLNSYDALKELYRDNRRVSVLLGGPPCKGFSRIGRAVIRELRSQGAHAWSCNKFGDERNALMYHYVTFIEALQPDVFLFENVSNFSSKLKTPDGDFDGPQLLEELINSLNCSEFSYSIDARIVRAKEHAIPQARERYIMCGISSRIKSVNPNFILEIQKFNSEVTLGEALRGLPDAKIFRQNSNKTSDKNIVIPQSFGENVALSEFFSWVINSNFNKNGNYNTDCHIYRKPREDDARFYKILAPGIRWMDLKISKSDTLEELHKLLTDIRNSLFGIEEYKDIVFRTSRTIDIINDSLALRMILEHISADLDGPHHLLEPGYLTNGSGQHGDWLERLSASKPCKTIVAHIGKDTYGYIHPFEPRPISIREAARIQSFPDWFSFRGVGVVDAYSMIGNAVPPLLARHFAQKIAISLGMEKETLHPSEPTMENTSIFQQSLPLEENMF